MAHPRTILRTPAPLAVALSASLWMATIGNAPLWREVADLGLLAVPLALALATVLTATLWALLSLVAWRPLFKPLTIALLVVTALGGHFMWVYHAVIDSTMASNAAQTDWHEVQALLTWQLAAVVVLGAALPAWLVWRTPVTFAAWQPQALRNAGTAAAALLLAIGAILLAFQPLASGMRNHKQLRYLMNPLNALYAVGQITLGPHALAPGLAAIGTDAVLPASRRPPLLLLVLGETGRSGNFGVNGYARDTTPELARAGVASFRNAWSCGTSTAASVPCMFSPLGRDAFLARSVESENLLDVVQRAGLAVLWLDNQPGGCKGVCDRVPTVNTSASADPRFCGEGECLDGVLLEGLDARLAALPADRRERGVVLVLHQMGSHGPAYGRRSPAAYKRFLPECASSHLPDCGGDSLRNAYDNSIAYTDHVLAAAIGWLRTRDDFDAALLYVADHGESLGENNLYLHGMPYAIAPDVQKHVPWITWFAPAFEQRSGISAACLRLRADARVSHDHLFHSVLGLLQVQTRAYRRELDAYAACAAH